MAKAESQTDDLISLSESKFIINGLSEQKRIDGRGLYDVRTLRLTFGSTWGRVQVQLGQTRYVFRFFGLLRTPLSFAHIPLHHRFGP
jgi:exosome complex RNA-binding protein Rrp42 (RNase PH superfamily)